MQILEPPQTESYTNEKGHYIKTFLISTKANEAGWKVSRCSIAEAVKSFVGKPFVIIPDHLSSQRQKGHIFANSRDELLEKYKTHTHGIIESVSEPFSYNDGTDDVFYTANIKLNDSKAASALLESGAKTWVPFAVSPHIWHHAGPEDNITKWEGISLSLVPKGAYGQEAVINKYCKGEEGACQKSLAAAFVKQEAVPLKDFQLDDLHAAMRVNTEENMESEISDLLFRRIPDDPLERINNIETGGQAFTPVSEGARQFTIRSIQKDPKGYLSDVLVNAQQPKTIGEFTVGDNPVEVPSLRDQYKAIVNKDLSGQWEKLDTNDPNYWDKQTKLSNAMNFRDNQVDAEYDSVIDEMQTDINNENMDLDTDGQIISERFDWESGSTAMAEGKYGQTNGGIRGITDSSFDQANAGGGGGECCIFNPAGGGGCGPCNGRAASIINDVVSSYLTKDRIKYILCLHTQLSKAKKVRV